MANIGVNIPRDGSGPIDKIEALNVNWVRIVLMPDVDLKEYFSLLNSKGQRILGIIAKESFKNYTTPTNPEVIAQLHSYRDQYSGIISAIQSGNEPDGEGPSSWTMSGDEFSQLGTVVRQVFPSHIPIVTGGLASGQPSWLDDVDLSWAQALGIHAYLKDAPNPDDIEDLTDIIVMLQQYSAVTLLPQWVTEWGWWGTEPARAREEIHDMISWASGTQDIIGLMYFCLTDKMVPPFGLYDTKYKLKSQAKSFASDVEDLNWSLWPEDPTPPVIPPPAKPTFDPQEFFTYEQIAIITNCPLANVTDSWPRIIEQLVHVSLNTRPVQIALAANIAQETAHRFLAISEFRNADGSIPSWWYSYGGGPDYHGRGFIQNTHLDNYRALGIAIAMLWGASINDPAFDFVRFPDNLLNPDMSAAAAAIYVRDHARDDGVGIPEAAAARDWTEVRRLINGSGHGSEAAGIAQVAETLWALPLPSNTQLGQTTDEVVEQYKFAMRTLVRELMPKLAESATIREQTLAEGERILKQYGAD